MLGTFFCYNTNMAKPILVANWKNHPASLEEAKSLIRELSKAKLVLKKTRLFIAPPLPYFELVSSGARSFAGLASQNMFAHMKGSYTGGITPGILKSFGVRLAIVGHSERRAQGESSEAVSLKVKAALKAGIAPLVCVGEPSRDADGEYFEVLRDEIKASLAGLSKSNVSSVIIAYEPVWAIGKSAKESLAPAELAESVIFIRKVLSDLFGRKAAESVHILYGGSVEYANAGTLARESGISGFLVGHASLNAKQFVAIAKSLTGK